LLCSLIHARFSWRSAATAETFIILRHASFALLLGISRRIEQLYGGLEAGEKHQVLLALTGSGKTFTMAKLIEQANRPALVLAHKKRWPRSSITNSRDFSPKRRRIFRQLLRFLPAGAYVPRRHLHRQGSHHQRRLDKLRMSATRSLSKGAT